MGSHMFNKFRTKLKVITTLRNYLASFLIWSTLQNEGDLWIISLY